MTTTTQQRGRRPGCAKDIRGAGRVVDIYRTLDYVRDECARPAHQIKALESSR